MSFNSHTFTHPLAELYLWKLLEFEDILYHCAPTNDQPAPEIPQTLTMFLTYVHCLMEMHIWHIASLKRAGNQEITRIMVERKEMA